MLKQYTMPEMEKIFSLENRYQLMTDITVLACEALADIGYIPKAAFEEIKAKAGFDIHRVEEFEAETRHQTLAFLSCLSERIGPDSARFVHMGLCSSDISDTATALQICQAADLLQLRLDELRKVLVSLANKYKYTLMMGRTHATHAEPITFGLKMAMWVKEIDRAAGRLAHARSNMAVGKINGVVGSFASVDPHVETYVCRRLGLHADEVTNQIIQRDRLAEFITTLSMIGCSIEKFSTEIRNLQRTDIHEVEEYMAEGQRGSTSLPHKRRPYRSELVSGLARVLRGYAQTAMEDIVVWHEQDSTHSSVERIIMPDSSTLLDYMLSQFTQVMRELIVYPDQMKENIDKSLGLVFSQHVLIALLEKGVPRETAYDMVMRAADIAWEQQTDFQFLLLEDEQIGQFLSRKEIMDLFNYNVFLKHIDYIFDRAAI